jgi:glycosyltransferase involved in cell wall biosynthesis
LIANPKITIVTPVYNCVEYIEETIKSVLTQNYKNIEYIIVDGGSSDGTCKIIEKYLKKINFFISEKDEGMYDALNKGFKMATGKYLAWLNADDLYFNNCISKTVELMEKNNYQWINGISGTLIKKNLKLRPLYYYPNIILKNRLMTPCLWGYIPQESIIFTKKLYSKVGGINRKLKYAGDFDLWSKFSINSELISVNIPIGIFRKRNNQMSENQKIYLQEVNKIHCFIPFGKILRFLYSLIINNFNKHVKKDR